MNLNDKKALIIGIEYHKSKDKMEGAANDAKNIKNMLHTVFQYDIQSITLMTEKQNQPNLIPTRENILAQFKKLAEDAKKDRAKEIVVFYAGHQIEPNHSINGVMPRILPIDYRDKTKGPIYDAELMNIFNSTADMTSCRVLMIFDCCHSSQNIFLPHQYWYDKTCDFKGKIPYYCYVKTISSARFQQKNMLMPLQNEVMWKKIKKWKPAVPTWKWHNKILPTQSLYIPTKKMIILSACKPSEKAAGLRDKKGDWRGILTHSLISILKKTQPNKLTCKQLCFSLAKTTALSSAKNKQTPILSSNFPISDETPFFE
tara:strand:+ start:318 stop:1262 length:945 start_codon:yes stop_codon:yes gene_type:complete